MTIITPGALNAGQITTTTLANDSVDATKIDFGTGSNQVDTDVLPEGSTNLYHTSERVDDRVNALLTAGSNITLTYDDTANTLTIAGVEDNLSNNDTDDLSEGSTNLYYTDARFNTAFSGKSTTDLSEGSNLYYTDARAIASVLTTAHSGNITLGSNQNVQIESGTDANEYIYLKSKDNYFGIDSSYLFIDADSNAIKLSVAGSGNPTEIEIDDKLKVDGHLEVTGAQVDFTALPTSDPTVAGRLWNDSGTVKISAG